MGHRILIADDDESSRKGLKALLSSFGYAVEPAANGQEALEKSETNREVRLLRRRLQVDAQAQEILLVHPWRGNVRDLRNTMERAFIVCEAEPIAPRHIPISLPDRSLEESSDVIKFPLGITVAEAEKKISLTTLASVNNNKAGAARILGISLKTLHNKLHRYGT